jgi:flavodoxin
LEISGKNPKLSDKEEKEASFIMKSLIPETLRMELMKRRKLLAAALAGAGLTPFARAADAVSPKRKIAIVYFSRDGDNYWSGGTKFLEKGNTARFAEKIAKLTGGTLFRLETVKTYPAKYRDATEVGKDEQKRDARPEIKGAIPDLSGYDTVFFGHPIWWGDMPMVMRTFLDKEPLAGKTVVHFTTHGGSGLGRSDEDLRKRAKASKFLTPKAVAGTDVDEADAEIAAWIKGLNL